MVGEGREGVERECNGGGGEGREHNGGEGKGRGGKRV